MRYYSPLIVLFLLITFSPFSQKNNSSSDYRLLYSQAEKLYSSANATNETDHYAFLKYQQVINILNAEKKYTDTLVDSYIKCGILKMSGNESTIALSYFSEAMGIIRTNGQLSDSLLFKTFLYTGSIYYSRNDLDSAGYYYKQAELIDNKYPALNESERLFNKFGALYYETGDYNKSISYFEKALSIVESKFPVNIFFVINYKNNIATALMKAGKNKEALEIFGELMKYQKPADELLYNIANTYSENGNYEKALDYLRRIQYMDLEKFISLTKLFINIKCYDSASFYLNKARNIYQQKKNAVPVITRGIILKYSGDLQSVAGKYSEALEDYQSAIISLDASFTDTAITANPESFSGLQNFFFLFETLIAKASLLGSLKVPNEENRNLSLSMLSYGSALSLARHIEKTYFSDDARLFLKTKVNPATRDAVNVAIRLYGLSKDPKFINIAFGFVENNKSTVLQTGLKNLELSFLPGLPLNLVSEEKKYKTILAKLSIQASLLKDSLSQVTLQTEIHNTEIKLSAVQDKLDEYPQYHHLKYYNSSINLDSVKDGLKEKDEAILSYYYTNTSLICFYITKEAAGFSAIPLDNTLFSTIYSLREELQSPQASGRKNLMIAGSSLFKQLIKPVFEKIKDKKRLVIIPFNEISFVPFEMLVDTIDKSLLVKKFAISYNYTAGFLTDKNAGGFTNYNVLAMAPFSEEENPNLVLPSLPLSVGEISGLPGKKLSGPEAVKDQFILLSGKYPVIHLATHAIANDSNLLGSYIEFYGVKKDADTSHRLYEQEIYTLDLKSARLVILSACETGNGLLVNGEGIISLSRGFSYAGCKSVITSLWKADELSTSFICKRLHHYLQKGFAIDRALQQSKIDYVETSEIEERYKNPAYWAHLVLIGDYRPVVKPGYGLEIFWISAAAIALIVFFAIKKKNRV
jgi:CHAT domain-containing protein/tetratricopeptide (TPR) repeat protein